VTSNAQGVAGCGQSPHGTACWQQHRQSHSAALIVVHWKMIGPNAIRCAARPDRRRDRGAESARAARRAVRLGPDRIRERLDDRDGPNRGANERAPLDDVST
jgi:hypothetical protein